MVLTGSTTGGKVYERLRNSGKMTPRRRPSNLLATWLNLSGTLTSLKAADGPTESNWTQTDTFCYRTVPA